MQDWKKQAEHLKFDKGLSYTQISEILFPQMGKKDGAEKIRNYLRRTARYKQKQKKDTPTGTTSISGNKDGSTTFEGIVALMDGEAITPEIIMRGHNLDVNKWDVVTYKTNFWQAQQKGGGTMLLYQSKITVKPKAYEQRIDYKAIDKHFDELDRKYKPMIILPARQQGTMTAEVNIADLHFGKLCWHGDTGNNYDYKIARSIYQQIISDAYHYLQGLPVKQIIFPVGNDLINSDTPEKTTTAGTPQDTDIRWQKLINTVEEMVIKGIEALKEIAPLEAIYIKSNHDEVSTYGVINTINAWFRNDDRVTVDRDAKSRKYRMYGNTLVGYSHGDKERPQKGTKYRLSGMAAAMSLESQDLWGKAKYREFHAAHIHSEHAIEEINGVLVRRISAPTATDTWHYDGGFVGATRKAQIFLYDDEYGVTDIKNIPVKL